MALATAEWNLAYFLPTSLQRAHIIRVHNAHKSKNRQTYCGTGNLPALTQWIQKWLVKHWYCHPIELCKAFCLHNYAVSSPFPHMYSCVANLSGRWWWFDPIFATRLLCFFLFSLVFGCRQWMAYAPVCVFVYFTYVRLLSVVPPPTCWINKLHFVNASYIGGHRCQFRPTYRAKALAIIALHCYNISVWVAFYWLRTR